ncbi:MAG: exo-beta-N-acetylmuramidase NamZ family protein [Ignavibacteria bacterium]
MKKTFITILLFFISLNFAQSKVRLGNDKLIKEYFYLIESKNIGIIANHSSVLENGEHLIDYLYNTKKVNIIAAYGPEHGFRGDAPAGEKIESSIDPKTGIPVYSLYGKINKPTPEMLKGIEVLVYDIQDVGARFYTYISTLYLCLEAAAENNIKFIVCDRPNPIGGEKVDGPILKEDLKSFVGIAPLPIQHGMTIGELALYFNDIIESKKNVRADLIILQMDNWRRNQLFDETGLIWIKPSPNIVNLEAALVYPGTCLFEATNTSEGRGTYLPFLQIGAPFINNIDLIKELKSLEFTAVELTPIEFVPVDIPKMSTNPKFKNVTCKGILINVKDYENFYPVQFGIALISTLKKLYPDDFKINLKRMNLLVGDEKVTELLNSAEDYKEIVNYYQYKLTEFKQIRKKYLLYN